METQCFVVFVDENIDADGRVYLLKFRSVAKFKRKMESGDVQIFKVFSIVVNHEYMTCSNVSVDVTKNGPY